MKILAIRIKNLASLEGTTEIDFTAEPLCSAGIFAITGATGAGKSTILDALCLALYGKTPRYLQARETGVEIKDVQGSTLSQGDIRGILRDGTADGFAEVDFRGIDGQNYRATWSVRRARNRADGSMQSDSVTLKNISNQVDLPGRKAETYSEIARLVGLNFEQFTRSVLLAQGDFTAFMKANRDEKSSLLEKLTGTHIYSEISKKIYEKYKAEEVLLRDLQLQKEGILTLSDEELQTLAADQELLERQITDLDKEIERLNAGISWYEQLAKYSQGHDEAILMVQQATENKDSALPRSRHLRMAEQAQQTRSWADALVQSQEQHTVKTTVLATVKETLISLQQQKESLEKQLQQAEHQLSFQNKNLTDALPLLEEARKLDTLLGEKKQQVDRLQEEAEKAAGLNRQHKDILKGKQQAFTDVVSQIESITQWQTEQAARKPIAENKDLILSKLEDAQKLLKNQKASSEKLVELKDKIQAAEVQQKTLADSWKNQLQLLDENRKTYDSKSEALRSIPMERLTLDKTETDQKVEETVRAQAQWQLLHYAQTEWEHLWQKQVQEQADHQAKQELLQQLKQELPLAKAESNTADQILQQARLASAENVETLREALVEDKPCPVCGSTHHPYAIQNPQLEKVLAQLEKSSQEKTQYHLSLHSRHDALEQECTILQQNIQRRKEEIHAKESALATQKQTWEQSDIAKNSLNIPDSEKSDWIAAQLQTLKTKQADLSAQLQAYAGQKQELEAAKTGIDQLKENTDTLAGQLKDLQNSLSLYDEQQSQAKREQELATAHLGEIEQLLAPHFTTSGWMNNWKAAPETFVENITVFAQQWQTQAEKLEVHTREKAALEATLKELENQAKTLETEANSKIEIHRTQQQSYVDLTKQRKNLFDGQSADETELQFKQAVTKAQEDVALLKTKQQHLAIEQTKILTQQEELTNALTTLESGIQQTSRQLQDWLNDYNQKNGQSLNLEDLHQLLALGNDWIENERAALQAIDEELTRANSILTERKKALDSHQQNGNGEIPLEELMILQTTARSEVEEKKHKKGKTVSACSRTKPTKTR
ncbi:AAA family ATPase [Pedobacter suwonensis]|uniref:AAA family ATPase n=1 Tax=Pedobacter suwonensis TaxID=332999 RepID=UPI00119CC32E|nr:AAA family ATPase [Pedobacter suwonensis]